MPCRLPGGRPITRIGAKGTLAATEGRGRGVVALRLRKSHTRRVLPPVWATFVRLPRTGWRDAAALSSRSARPCVPGGTVPAERAGIPPRASQCVSATRGDIAHTTRVCPSHLTLHIRWPVSMPPVPHFRGVVRVCFPYARPKHRRHDRGTPGRASSPGAASAGTREGAGRGLGAHPVGP